MKQYIAPIFSVAQARSVAAALEKTLTENGVLLSTMQKNTYQSALDEIRYVIASNAKR